MINELKRIEKKYFKYFYKSGFDFRELIIGKFLDEFISKKKIIYKKKICNNIKINFFHNSKISREFFLNPLKKIKYIWEPQTTKLILSLSKDKKNIFFAVAFFGDQASLCAFYNKKSKIHAFEPNENQTKCLKLNKKNNHLNNLIINENVLYSKSNLNFSLRSSKINNKKFDEGEVQIFEDKVRNNNSKISITIDEYCKKNNINNIELMCMDVEGAEDSIIEGAKKMLKKDKVNNIIFELNSNYVSWKNGLQKVKIIQLFKKYKFKIYAIRDLHSSFNLKNINIELLPLNKVYLKGPKHGFNMIATKNNLDKYIVNKLYSPKYLFHKKDGKFHTEGLIDAYKN